jgi:hypothetical protein
MKSLGMKIIRVQWEDFPSEQAAVAYGIADNKSSEFAEWDDMVLCKLLESQDIAKLSGFNTTEVGIIKKLGTVAGNIDPNVEWEGMPEFKLNKKAFRSIVIHFENQKNVDTFSNVIEQLITDKTRYLWFPKKEVEKLLKKGFV